MAALTAFYNNFELHGSQFYNTNGEYGMSIHCSFGDTGNLFGSPGLSWSGDLYASCNSGVTSLLFSDAEISPLSNDLGQVVYPTEEALLLSGDDSEFLQQLNGSSCNNNNNNQPGSAVMHPTLVDTLKTPESPELVAEVAERYSFECHQELLNNHEIQSYQQQQQSGRAFFEPERLLADSPQMCRSDESGLTTHDVTVAVDSELYDEELEIKHEPPPLNMKRLEKIEEPDESIEAAEVSVDLIQNKRPFQCGLAGCNKTFKNPQTMKMHHKTHYTDGSAIGVATLLPTLTSSSLKAGQNKKIPSRCPKCRKTFVGLYELRRHYGRKHSEGEKPFGCRKCGKKFYIEVDVRDHEKLCGEPIECKCGLKFAFKCNLVAHKKAHPECQSELQILKIHHHRHRHSNSANSTTTTSDGESTCHSRSARGTKRHRATSSDFKCLPEAKAARHDFAGLEFSTEGSAMWGSNMHSYPSNSFANLAGLEHIAGHCQSFHLSHKQELPGPVTQSSSSLELLHLHPKFNALHSAMARLN